MNNIQISVYLSEEEKEMLEELVDFDYNKSSAVREGIRLLYKKEVVNENFEGKSKVEESG